ncbi:MAG: hydrogenase maturation protease [Acidobacteriota bacterium]|nr:hydrogenase maturation protease [Acidobacteriota bacterium]
MNTPRVAVIGIGTPEHADDAAGLVVARRVREQAPPSVDVHEVTGDGIALLETWHGYERVILVDAVFSGRIAGTLHRFDGRNLPDSERIRLSSTQALGLRETLRLAESLERLPGELIVIGIEADELAVGREISSDVEAAIPDAVDLVIEEIGRDAGVVSPAPQTDAGHKTVEALD